LGKISQRREILERLLTSVPSWSEWHRRLLQQTQAEEVSVGVHLAIFVEPYLTAVLEGKKTIESRFAVTRRPPYDCIQSDDYILLKRSGGPILGLAVAKSIRFFRLSPSVLTDLRRRFAQQLFAQDDSFWIQRADKHYATFIELEHVAGIKPLSIQKRDRQGWITYDRQDLRQTVQLRV
jgi:hypothetical protein